ncbi:MAG: Aspartate/glutamate leucyltransferase [Syntrophus sp. SKADARSKE-3]|nr:Aspartate/glutamate leucyltransferase [Syntrophus sp. SKADARSKE-3]
MINEAFECLSVKPAEMDLLWFAGFRHFGTLFFRYDTSVHGQETVHVIPLRIDLRRFSLSKSQKRNMARNRDLHVVFRDAFVDEEKYRLFEIHKQRFTENIPGDLCDFISSSPATIPCHTLECCLFHDEKLIGAGFLDMGMKAASAVYSIYDTADPKRSLGIHLLLREIAFCREAGMNFLYHGYAYQEASFYDYKKRFSGLEYYDWQGHWSALSG